MTRKLLFAPLLALTFASAPALAMTSGDGDADASTASASIPFADKGNIRDWVSNGERTIYIEDSHDDWYKARLMSRSFDLPYAWKIGFVTGPSDALDKFSRMPPAGELGPELNG